ncbi:MAG TPA: hypothetical protein VFX42_01845 [Gemmatimonadales bacterium]|nr:hypothetical protein [Gemmatimonadales bacterium]
MTETLERAGAESPASNGPSNEPRRSRWTRTHTIWLLIVLSLIPGVVIALDREQWATLPAGIRAATYLTSAILLAAACSLILLGGAHRDDY